MKKYYITTPIYYVNDVPHIGHAYTTLACDVLARFKRLDGYDVKFLTGTDEHGQKIENSAKLSGIHPKTFTNKVSQNFRDLANFMEFSHDDFIRTTEQRHLTACQALWRSLAANGCLYLGTYSGWYAVRDEAFYNESEISFNKEGERIAPSGAKVEWIEEPSYFFNLSEWKDPLLKYYEKHPDFISPKSRRNEVLNFVKKGLNDLSVSRTTFKWGIPVPNDEAHIMYVWLDALTNYITATGYPDFGNEDGTFWPADIHIVGKDILRFHAIYWPAFLMAAGLEIPKKIFAHGWWTNQGKKISKSIGNVIDPIELVKKYGLDQVRFFLLREVPFGNDGDFSHKAIISRINGDLANDYGNLIQRVLSMIYVNFDATIPMPGKLLTNDTQMLNLAYMLLAKGREKADTQAFHQILTEIWAVIRAANAYVDGQAPWTLKNKDLERMGTILFVLAETIRNLALLTQPFMPSTSEKILNQLSIPTNKRSFSSFGKSSTLQPGTKISKPEGVFPRYLDEK